MRVTRASGTYNNITSFPLPTASASANHGSNALRCQVIKRPADQAAFSNHLGIGEEPIGKRP